MTPTDPPAAVGTASATVTVLVPSSAQLVSTSQAAAILGISARAVTKRIERGDLPATRVGREWVLSEYEVGSRADGRQHK